MLALFIARPVFAADVGMVSISNDTISNLRKVAGQFKEEYGNFCKAPEYVEVHSEDFQGLCLNPETKIPYTEKIVADSIKNDSRFFETVYGFYNELFNFGTESNKIKQELAKIKSDSELEEKLQALVESKKKSINDTYVKIRNDLRERLKEISKREVIIFDYYDQMSPSLNDRKVYTQNVKENEYTHLSGGYEIEYEMLGYSKNRFQSGALTFSSNKISSRSFDLVDGDIFIYPNEPDNDAFYGGMFCDKDSRPGDCKGKLSMEDCKGATEAEVSSNCEKVLNKINAWNEYVGALIGVANKNIGAMDKFITEEKNECFNYKKDERGSCSADLKENYVADCVNYQTCSSGVGDGKYLYTAVEECRTEIDECINRIDEEKNAAELANKMAELNDKWGIFARKWDEEVSAFKEYYDLYNVKKPSLPEKITNNNEAKTLNMNSVIDALKDVGLVNHAKDNIKKGDMINITDIVKLSAFIQKLDEQIKIAEDNTSKLNAKIKEKKESNVKELKSKVDRCNEIGGETVFLEVRENNICFKDKDICSADGDICEKAVKDACEKPVGASYWSGITSKIKCHFEDNCSENVSLSEIQNKFSECMKLKEASVAWEDLKKVMGEEVAACSGTDLKSYKKSNEDCYRGECQGVNSCSHINENLPERHEVNRVISDGKWICSPFVITGTSGDYVGGDVDWYVKQKELADRNIDKCKENNNRWIYLNTLLDKEAKKILGTILKSGKGIVEYVEVGDLNVAIKKIKEISECNNELGKNLKYHKGDKNIFSAVIRKYEGEVDSEIRIVEGNLKELEGKDISIVDNKGKCTRGYCIINNYSACPTEKNTRKCCLKK